MPQRTADPPTALKRNSWLSIGIFVAVWVVLFGQPTGWGHKLRGAAVWLATPFVRLADLIPVVHSRRTLLREVQRLRVENERLQQQLQVLGEQARENLTLRRLLQFRQQAGSRMLAARVIGRDVSNWWQSLQIDRGWEDGLTEELAVVTADGVVGRTISVWRAQSRVLLLVDPSCRVSALLQDSRTHGIVSGSAETFQQLPRCVMSYVERRTAVRPGEAVVTSGFGGVFPAGLLLGHVEKVSPPAAGALYQELVVRPAVDFQRLETVLVMVAEQP